MNNNWDKYLDPPDEPEAEVCEACGHELEWENYSILSLKGGLRCTNRYCPDKHEGITEEMAEILVEMEYTIRRLEMKVKILESML